MVKFIQELLAGFALLFFALFVVLPLVLLIIVFVMQSWINLISTIIFFIVLPYVLFLLASRFFARFNIAGGEEVFELESDLLPEEVIQSLSKIEKELSRIGFQRKISLKRSYSNFLESIEVLYLHRNLYDVGEVKIPLHRNKDVSNHKTRDIVYTKIGSRDWDITFETRFTDQTIIATSNSSSVYSFPWPHNIEVSQLPSLQNPSDLYKAHHFLKSNSKGKYAQIMDEVDWLLNRRDYLNFYLKFWAKKGHIYLLPNGKLYGMTWKGSIIGCFTEAWPFSLVQQKRNLNRSLEMERFLGID